MHRAARKKPKPNVKPFAAEKVNQAKALEESYIAQKDAEIGRALRDKAVANCRHCGTC
jgi:hypothetical protein